MSALERFAVNAAEKLEPVRGIAVLGAPINMGASQRGTLMGPAALRTAGLLALLESLGFGVTDHGDLTVAEMSDLADPPPVNTNHYREIQRWTRALSRQGYELARSGAIPIFLGGDHSLSMGSVNAVSRHWQEVGRELFVLWLDAHADYNTPSTTPTANMHGMAAAFLCGEGGLDSLLGNEPRASISPDRLKLFGTRSIDKLEQDLLRARRVSVAEMREIDEFRRRFSRSCRRAGSWDDGAGRRDLPRSASDHGAAARIRAGRIRRYCRTQSISGRARQDGADCGRADRQSVRPANHESRQPLAICRGICCLQSSSIAKSAILIMRQDRQSRADARLLRIAGR
jgi:arginase family enzyme